MNCNLDLRKVVDLIIKDLLVFKTAVEYYNNHGSKVFVAAYDLTKTCDRLNQSITILKLYDIGVPRDIVTTFVFWFQHLCAIFVWNGCYSPCLIPRVVLGRVECVLAGYLICVQMN